MNTDEPGEEHILDEDIHGEFDEYVLHDLVAEDILDLDIDQNNPNMEGGSQGAGQQDPQK